jgi:CheY-like chemotaxis protein
LIRANLLLTAFSDAPRSLGRPTLLIVEDHADTRQMYAHFLHAEFEVLEAGDGAEAWELLGRRVPDVVVTDLSLPGIDGYALIELMRGNEATRGVPVICLSGFGGHAHEERARAAGCDRILQKPCLPDALANVAREIVGERRSNRR